MTTLHLESSPCEHMCRNCGCSPIWITHTVLWVWLILLPTTRLFQGFQQPQKSSPCLELRKRIPSSQREVTFLALLASPWQVSYLTFSEVCKKIVSSSTLPDGCIKITLRHILRGSGRRKALPCDSVTYDFHHSACISSCCSNIWRCNGL